MLNYSIYLIKQIEDVELGNLQEYKCIASNVLSWSLL